MPTTIKRAHIALTAENWRQLETLMQRFGENRSEVMKRAITVLFNETEKWHRRPNKLIEER